MKEKLKESIVSVTPVTIIVILLCFLIHPFPIKGVVMFVVGAFLLVLGMSLFTMGAENSMGEIGERVGAHLTKTKKLWIIVLIAIIIGTIVTIAEPDLQVLATQIPSINSAVLIGVVSIGVGIFLAIAILRIIFNIKLSYVFLIFYLAIFIISIFVPEGFWTVAFDAGGVSTGSITVPLILALGVGVTFVFESKKTENDTFGIMALASIGPILTVLIFGLFYPLGETAYDVNAIADFNNVFELIMCFAKELPSYMKEVAISMFPIIVFFLIYQFVALRLSKRELIKIGISLVYTFLGISIFLTGGNVGFMPLGNYIGTQLAMSLNEWLVIAIAVLVGYFLVRAEPAVAVLNKQVADITDGAISEKIMRTTLSIGVAISVFIAMLRVYTGISIMYFLVPIFVIALSLAFIVPEMFTAIAFDSGGIASGTMTATFLLPFAVGVCEVIGGNILTDAFGFVGIVSVIPIVCIQVLGLIYKLKTKGTIKSKANKAKHEEIIEL